MKKRQKYSRALDKDTLKINKLIFQEKDLAF